LAWRFLRFGLLISYVLSSMPPPSSIRDSARVPDAMQHEVVHRCSGTFAGMEFAAIPGLRRIISLRYMLRRAREMLWLSRYEPDHPPPHCRIGLPARLSLDLRARGRGARCVYDRAHPRRRGQRLYRRRDLRQG